MQKVVALSIILMGLTLCLMHHTGFIATHNEAVSNSELLYRSDEIS